MRFYRKEKPIRNQKRKPKQTARQLVLRMEQEKGIQFKYTNKKDAEIYLANVNNYFRTAAYRKNYQKYLNGKNKGKYIGLDFAYLQELSTLDMHLRFIISKMCSDIEHALKVQMVKDIEADTTTDGYDITSTFLAQNHYIREKLESTCTSPFTGDLIKKYFTLQSTFNPKRRCTEYKIIAYNDCPAWVLLELLTFGDFIRFYKFYYANRNLPQIPTSIIHLVKSLRNAAAHNNCIIANLAHGTSVPPPDLSQAIRALPTISDNQRRKKLSCRPMLEFTALLYVYQSIVSEKVKYHRIKELKYLFFKRIPQKKGFFKDNELIKSNYKFACTLITTFFG